ncbi:MAG: MiaB/RimO family radical SAM methylthiotransferase [Candidatus Omnitrophica bacterium]|nr:MiaB/RimO family radical SAM methylthiotransferase [Candidatus Omnitrophota bacterium]
MKNKVGILSLGCPRNLVDSENILGRLQLKGHAIVDMKDAEVGIVNTCAFIEEAKRESIDAILDLIELKKSGKLKKVIVYGCLAQRYKEELKKELPEVDAFIGKVSLNHEVKRYPITPKHFAYLKICEGCINNCSYCVIPKIKGKFVSLEEEAILKKVAQFSAEKLSELNIIGQDITGYGVDICGKPALAAILKKIVRQAKNIRWIRFLYLHPDRVGDDLLDLIRVEPKLCKYIDLPIQHINNRILKLMNRRTGRAEIEKLIKKIRSGIPGVAIRTSVITGFPTETDKEFKELLDFIKETKFDRLGAFTYSAEEGTVAFDLKPQVPDQVKRERFDRIMKLQQDVSVENNRKLLGKTLEVLIDEKGEGSYLGRTQFDAPEVDGMVYVNSKLKLKPGDFVKVKITDTLEYDLVGDAR